MSFEVQTYKNGNWDISAVVEDKDSAIAEAQNLLQRKTNTSVRVVEEIHDEVKDEYRSKVIFRREKSGKGGKKEGKDKRSAAAKQKPQDDEDGGGDSDEEDEEGTVAASRKKIGFEKIFIGALFAALLLAGAAAGYWQSQQPDPEPEEPPAKLAKRDKGPPPAAAVSLEEKLLKDAWSEITADNEKAAGNTLTDAEGRDISGHQGPDIGGGEWKSVSKTAQKGFTEQRKDSGSGNGAGSDEEELAALPPSGAAVFFPLPVFKYSDVRNRKLERAVVLQVTLDVVGDEGLEKVKEKADDLYKALEKELSRIVSKAEKNTNSFAIPSLKKRFLAVCARELGKGVVRGILIQDSREARSRR